jgi:hypothetical protein
MIVASLTTIPSRINTSCRLAIDSLLSQVDHIYLSVCDHYARFGPIEIPADFQREPYVSKVTIVKTEDYGSATKILGALPILDTLDTWVFVCDDDQEYSPTLIDRMKPALGEPGLYQNLYHAFNRQSTTGGLVHGYVGFIIHSSCLRSLKHFPFPEEARFVDDQYFSIYCFLHGIPLFATGIEEYPDVFAVMENNHEKWGVDALASIGNRGKCISAVAAFFQVEFRFDWNHTPRNHLLRTTADIFDEGEGQRYI